MTPAEELKDAVREGRMAFSDWKEEDGQPRPVVEARLIRKLVLGHTARSGVRIRGAEIRGELNLVDARADNGACNALILEECVLTGGGTEASSPAIDARHAHLQRLSLTSCEVDGIELSSAVIENDVTLDGIRGRSDRQETLQEIVEWMRTLERVVGMSERARSIIAGLEFALLREYQASPGSARHAEVKLGSDGEFRVYSKEIPEEVETSLLAAAREERLAGLEQLEKETGEPQNLLADDDLELDWSQVPEGELVSTEVTPEDFGRIATRLAREVVPGPCWVKARGVRIGGSFMLRRATLRLPWSPDAEWPSPGAHECWQDLRAPFALDLQGAQIGGSVFLQPDLEAFGGVNLGTATIGGDLWARGARLMAAGVGQDSVDALRARSVDIRGRAEMTRAHGEDRREGLFKAYGTLGLSSGKIGGALRIEGAWDAPIQTEAAGVDIAGDLTIFGSVSQADFSGCVTHGDLCLGTNEDSLELNGGDAIEPPAVKLVGASIARAVRLGRPITVSTFPIDLERSGWLVRTAALHSHPKWRLAEARFFQTRASAIGIIAFLYRSDGKGRILLLDGRSDPIHSLNDVEPPNLESEEQARQYLSFFCNYLWADDGAFIVIDRPEDGIGHLEPIRDLERDHDGDWRIVAEIEYGETLFESTFFVWAASGAVEIEDDDPLRVLERRAIRYDAPFRWLDRDPSQPLAVWPPDPAEFEFTDDAPGLDWDAVIAELRRNLTEHRRPLIDLSGLKAGSLDDGEGAYWAPADEGEGWGKARRLRLALSGFEYDRIDGQQPAPKSLNQALPAVPTPKLTRRETVALRRTWLGLQYERYPPTERDYRPQPYEQLARTWRAAGHLKSADDITLDKLHLEKVKLAYEGPRPGAQLRTRAKHRFKHLWHKTKQAAAWGAVQVPFGFGLKPWRALFTLCVVYLIGLIAVLAIPLKVDAAAVSTVGRGESVVIDAAGDPRAPEEISCGDLVNVFVYPLDVMIPLLDLRQEARCQFSIKNEWLGVLKGAYAILGWLVISGAIITWSGVVRRHTER
jgi:hypothetical protein